MAGTISLGSNEISVHEGDGVALVTFKRAGDLTGAASITYGISADTATNGADFTGVNGVAVMPDGADHVTISIPIINDNIGELTEVFVVSIVTIANAAIGAPRTTRVSILDDENPVLDPVTPPLVSNYDVTMQPVITGLNMPIKMEFSPLDPNLVFVAEKGGVVKVFNLQTNQQVSTFINLTSVVNDVQDRGLMDIAFNPNFATNHYFYAFYVVDPADVAGKTGNAGPDGMGNRYAQVVRYTADAATNYTTAIAGSGVVLLGGAGQTLKDISGGGAIDFTDPANSALVSSEVFINPTGPAPLVIGGYKQDYIKLDSLSHAGGSLSFGPDGKLYVAIGDGTSFDFADPRTVSVQDVNSLSGKILRVDPVTGDGFADNPFYVAGMSLDTNAAKVYQLGLRNPFSSGWTPDGRLMLTNTGWFTYEMLFTGNAGANFGWPYFEGADAGVLSQTAVYKDFPQAQLFYQQMANGQVHVIPAFRAFAHDSALPGYQVQAVTGGDVVYTGNKYPVALQNDFFFTDQVDGEIFTVDVNDSQQLQFLIDMPNNGYGPTDYKQGPDGYVYYVDIMGVIGRILIADKPGAGGGGGGNPNFKANGSAVASAIANDFQLTNGVAQVGTVMSQTQIDVRQNFSIAFKMLFGQSDAGGDGMGFILHNDARGPATVGDGGWGLGFELIQNGLAISFDTYTNPERNDLATDGSAFENSATLAKTALVNLGNIEDGLYHDVVVAWNAATSTLTYTIDGILRGTLTDPNLIANYFGGSPNVYFGFTASTGGAFNDTHVTIGNIQATFAGAVNHAPVAGDDALIMTANSILTIGLNTLLQNDSDPDADPLLIGAFTNAQNGTVAMVNGQVQFTPTAGFVGAASFDYTILDGKGGQDIATVTVNVQAPSPNGFQANSSAVASGIPNDYRLTNGLGQVGTIMSQTQIDVRQNFSIAVKMLFGQTDAGADGMGFILHNDPRGPGTVGDGGWGLGYELIQNGLAISFDTYTNPERNDLVTDSTAFANSATLAKTALVNLGNIEDGLYHDVVVAWNAATSTLTYTIDGILRGTLTDPNLIANYFGGSPNVYFGFTASTGGAFNETHVTIGNIQATYAGGVNHAPVAVDDALIATANGILTIAPNTLLQNDTDSDGNVLQIGALTNAQNGVVALVNGQVQFTPTAGFVGAASFDYTVLDGKGGQDFATVTIDVKAAAPYSFVTVGSATAGAAPGEYVTTNAVAQVGAVNSTSRIDFTKAFTISYQHYFGASDAGADGSGFIFQNDPLGAATLGDGGWGLGLDYIQNGLGIAFDTYQNVERGEIANDSTFFVNTATLARTAFVDLGNIENGLYHPVVISWNAVTSTLTYSIDGILRGTLTDVNIAADYFGGSNFAYFGFTGSTGGAFNVQQVKAIDLDVVYEGRARPVANADTFQTAANTPLTIQAGLLLANDTDADNDALTLVSVSNAVNGVVSLVNGVVTLTPTAGFAGDATFNYKISDGFGATATGVATVHVTAPSGAPLAVNDGFTVAEDATLAVSAARNVLSNDSDPQGTALTAILVAGPSHGALTLNANGTFAYTPTANYNGADSFTYKASDGALTSAITTVNLTVTPVNDAPVITYNAGAATAISIPENTSPILAQVLATDVDGGVLTYTLTGADAGDFTISATGILRFAATPNFEAAADAGQNNVYNVTVQVSDAANAIDTQAFTITVTDAPEAAIINGTAAGNTINGTAAADQIQPLAGNDTASGSGSNDIFLASLNDGNDTYNGGNGSDTVSYAAITTAVTASLVSNTATGSQIGTDTYTSIENLIGGSAGDTLTGNGSVNRLDGGAGADTLTGGGAVDTFVFRPGTGIDHITDFSIVQDMIDLSAYNFGSYTALATHISQVGADTVIDLAPGDQVILTAILNTNIGPSEFLL